MLSRARSRMMRMTKKASLRSTRRRSWKWTDPQTCTLILQLSTVLYLLSFPPHTGTTWTTSPTGLKHLAAFLYAASRSKRRVQLLGFLSHFCYYAQYRTQGFSARGFDAYFNISRVSALIAHCSIWDLNLYAAKARSGIRKSPLRHKGCHFCSRC